MRELTPNQKKLLIKTLEENEPSQNEKSLFGNTNPINSVDNLPDGVWEKLEEMNDTEILWQEANRFIHEWRFAKLR